MFVALCAVPIAPSKMQDFNTYYQLGDTDLNELDFGWACNADNVKATLGALGYDWASVQLTSAPFGAMLRIAEGFDAVNNLGRSGMNISGVDRASAIVCGVSQLGGLIFASVALVFACFFCACAPIGGACAVQVYRRYRRTQALRELRERRIDAMLSRAEREPFL